NIINQVLNDLTENIQNNPQLQNLQNTGNVLANTIGKMFDPSKDITKDPEYKKNLEGNPISRFSPLLVTPPLRAELASKKEFYETYSRLTVQLRRTPTVEEVKESFN
ncbi:hypothetical protein RZS08_40125, partial [Arthrospira platensis SPKY1]|nr:hypothetical protein [Arthrospira platensis SPKY1]